RHPSNQGSHLADGRAVADDLVRAGALAEVGVLHGEALVRAAQLLDEPCVLAHELEGLEGTTQGESQLLAVPRLGHIAVDAAAVDGLHDGIHVGVPGQDDAHGVWPERHRALEELRATHRRHPLVGDDHGRVVDGEQLEAPCAALGGDDLEVVAVVEVERAEDVRLVVDHQDRKATVVGRHARLYRLPLAALSREAASPSGRMIRKVVPVPGALSASMRPPCAVTTPWLMARPRPVPCPTSLVVKKGSKTRRRTSGGMPAPSSRTETMAESPSTRVVSQRFPSPAIASQAFASTCRNTWF